MKIKNKVVDKHNNSLLYILLFFRMFGPLFLSKLTMYSPIGAMHLVAVQVHEVIRLSTGNCNIYLIPACNHFVVNY